MKKTILLSLLFISIGTFGKSLPKDVDRTEHYTMDATYYHAVKKQTNEDNLTTANGTKINPSHVKSGKQKILAMSRDMFKKGFKLGDKVWVEELNDYYIIADTMNKRFTRKVDVLIHQSHEPMTYTKLTIRKVKKHG